MHVQMMIPLKNLTVFLRVDVFLVRQRAQRRLGTAALPPDILHLGCSIWSQMQRTDTCVGIGEDPVIKSQSVRSRVAGSEAVSWQRGCFGSRKW